MDKHIALIDGDGLLYSCGFAVEKVVYSIVDDGEEVIQFDYAWEAESFLASYEPSHPEAFIHRAVEAQALGDAILCLKYKLRSLLAAAKTDTYSIFLSDSKNNYRNQIATILPYKGNRDSVAKPVHFDALKQYLLDEEFAVVSTNEEADDRLGIVQHSYIHTKSWIPVLISKDKDLLQIKGLHLNLSSKERFWVTEEEADKFFYCQLLAGDSIDNIPGLKGIGIKTASKLLDKLESTDREKRYALVLEKYKSQLEIPEKLGWIKDKSVEEVVNEIGQLIWIRRQDNQMWSPNLP